MSDAIFLGNVSYTAGYLKPAGMYRIATEIRNHGYSAETIDLFAFFNECDLFQLVSRYITEKTAFVGFSSTLLLNHITNDYFSVSDDSFFKLCRHIKAINSRVKIVVGGSQALPSFNSLHLKYADCVDYFISGQGELQAVALLRHIKEGESLNVKTIDNLKYLTSENYEYQGFTTSSIEYTESDTVFQGEALPIEISRGCAFKCSFCIYDNRGKKFGDIVKQKQVIRDELLRNHELFGTSVYMIMDDTLNDSMRKVEYLHETLTSLPFSINFISFARLDMISKYPDMAVMLKEMGLVGVSFGIETMHKEAGQKIGKGLGEKKVKHALKHCKDIWGDNVIINGNFILGLPHEPLESIKSTMSWVDSDECTLDSINIFPLNVSKSRSTSQFDKEAASGNIMCFGGESDSEWRHRHMSFSGAVSLKNHYDRYFQKKWPNFNKIGAFSIPRMVNIGFTVEDCLQINRQSRSSSPIIELERGTITDLNREIWQRTVKRRNEYIQQKLKTS
ncbi:MAG: radical SAM protein [Gammaproteobacteria bacterium]|nr:MAG: radical SAM protein [Gammaproteobacteria bacterium]